MPKRLLGTLNTVPAVAVVPSYPAFEGGYLGLF